MKTQTQNKNKTFTIQKSKISVSQNSTNIQRNFTITKKIAKHGSQSIIIIPRMLEQHLKPGTMMQLTIDIIDKFDEGEE